LDSEAALRSGFFFRMRPETVICRSCLFGPVPVGETTRRRAESYPMTGFQAHLIKGERVPMAPFVEDIGHPDKSFGQFAGGVRSETRMYRQLLTYTLYEKRQFTDYDVGSGIHKVESAWR
jgi:hypothetical protein